MMRPVFSSSAIRRRWWWLTERSNCPPWSNKRCPRLYSIVGLDPMERGGPHCSAPALFMPVFLGCVHCVSLQPTRAVADAKRSQTASKRYSRCIEGR